MISFAPESTTGRFSDSFQRRRRLTGTEIAAGLIERDDTGLHADYDSIQIAM